MSKSEVDACTGVILDFIAGGVEGNPVGETGGNYNAYFGHAHSTTDLGVRTLNGIYEFQKAMLAQDPRSTAIGRYQFLEKTLQGLQTELGLSGNELFTPELQDKLAVRLLVRRGYSDWWKGQIDDAGFAHRLSCEWASLPDPQKDGRSHYDGDSAGNHASTTLDAVYAMLKHAKSLITKETSMTDTAPAAAPAVAANPLDSEVERIAQIVAERLAAQAAPKGPGAIAKGLSFLVARMRENSSKVGLAVALPSALAMFGIHPSDQLVSALMQLAPIGLSLLAVMLPDAPKAPSQTGFLPTNPAADKAAAAAVEMVEEMRGAAKKEPA